MSFVDNLLLAVHLSEFGPLTSFLQIRTANAQTHRPALFGQFDAACFGDLADMSGKFNNGDLYTQTDTKIGLLILSGSLGSFDHAFCTSGAETAGNKNACSRNRGNLGPGFIVFGRVVKLGLVLEIGRINPDQIESLAQRIAACSSDFITPRYELCKFGVLADKSN